MSLSGVMDQSAAERQGFASLLQEKLRHLLMEDEVGGGLQYSGVQVTGRSARRLVAPAHSGPGWGGGQPLPRCLARQGKGKDHDNIVSF